MKNHQSDNARVPRGNPDIASFFEGDTRRTDYLDPSPLAIPKARFHTKTGIPLDAGVVPRLPIPTDSAATPVADAWQTPRAKGAMDDTQTVAGAAGYSPLPNDGAMPPPPPPDLGTSAGTYRDGPYSYPSTGSHQEPESSSLHALLVGLIVTASIVAGLGSSLWLDGSNKKAQLQAQLRARDSGAAMAKAPSARIADDSSASLAASANTRQNLVIADALPGGRSGRSVTPGESEVENPPLAAMVPSAKIVQPAPPVQPPMPADPAPLPKSDGNASRQPKESAAADEASPGKPLANGGAAVNRNDSRNDSRNDRNGTGRKATGAQVAVAPPAQPAAHKKKARAKASGASPRAYAGMPRKDRNEEIDRLKSQAFSETARDRIGTGGTRRKAPDSPYQFLPQSGAQKADTAPAAAKNNSLRPQLARCEHSGNFFVREQCKWRICDGRWGQHGCPSFETKSAAY